jgi:hypothetical protein
MRNSEIQKDFILTGVLGALAAYFTWRSWRLGGFISPGVLGALAANTKRAALRPPFI